jgi:hypothetical protein
MKTGFLHNIILALMFFATAGYCVDGPALALEEGDKATKEYLVKAAYLYNFVKFVQWPGAQALAQTHNANICIMGQDNFGSALDLFKKASSPQLTLNVKRDITENEITDCHILFISKSEEGRVSSILSRINNRPVLTVSALKGFADEGGIVEMVKVEKTVGLFSKDKINLRINVRAAEAENLRIDAQLLEIAAEVIK